MPAPTRRLQDLEVEFYCPCCSEAMNYSVFSLARFGLPYCYPCESEMEVNEDSLLDREYVEVSG